LPIRNIFVPQVGHTPWVAGLPFFMVTALGFFISFLALHFTQYPCIDFLLNRLILSASEFADLFCSHLSIAFRADPVVALDTLIHGFLKTARRAITNVLSVWMNSSGHFDLLSVFLPPGTVLCYCLPLNHLRHDYMYIVLVTNGPEKDRGVFLSYLHTQLGITDNTQ